MIRSRGSGSQPEVTLLPPPSSSLAGSMITVELGAEPGGGGGERRFSILMRNKVSARRVMNDQTSKPFGSGLAMIARKIRRTPASEQRLDS